MTFPNCTAKQEKQIATSENTDRSTNHCNYQTPSSKMNGQNKTIIQNDIFYDCQQFDNVKDQQKTLQEQTKIMEVLTKIENAKEFKSMLKNVAYTTTALYQTFRYAQKKSGKRKHKTKHTHTHRGKNKDSELFRKCDLNPLETFNEEILKRKERKRKKSVKKSECEKCPMCNEEIRYTVDGHNFAACCEDSSQISYKQNHPERQHKTKCAVKGESNLYKNNISEYGEKLNKFFDTLPESCYCADYITDEVKNKRPQRSKCSQHSKHSHPSHPLDKRVFNFDPIHVTIPLKLQVEGQNCQSRFIETEIVMKPTSHSQSKTRSVNKESYHPGVSKENNYAVAKIPYHPVVSKENNYAVAKIPYHPAVPFTKKPEKYYQIGQTKDSYDVSGSDKFGSCISYSSNANLPPLNEYIYEKAIGDIVHIIKYRDKETPASKRLLENKQQNKLLQYVPQLVAKKAPISQTNFSQTTEANPELKQIMQANKLRGELLHEIKAALEQTTPPLALKSLSEGKTFLQPTDLLAIKAEPGYGQADFLTVDPSGHFKRKQDRYEIQEHLKQLLEQDYTMTNYTEEERNEILQDLNKLFHPEGEGTTPKHISFEKILDEIRFLLYPELYESITGTKPAEQYNLKIIRHMLNPKFKETIKRKSYSKDIKGKILDNLRVLLTPLKNIDSEKENFRDIALLELQQLMDSEIEGTFTDKPTDFSRAIMMAQEDTNNSIRDSVLGDLRYLLDETNTSHLDDAKRNEVRYEIQENLKDLLVQPKSYNSEEKNKILLDLHKLFHPQIAGMIPRQISYENALRDVQFLLDQKAEVSQTASSQAEDNSLQVMKNVLSPNNLNSRQMGQYSNELIDKLLQYFYVFLATQNSRSPTANDIRDIALSYLQQLINFGKEGTYVSGTQANEIRDIIPAISRGKPTVPQKPSKAVTQGSQTDLTRVHPQGHYRRSEMRSEIQENLKELITQEYGRRKSAYSTDDRDNILFDLYKLFYPGTLPQQFNYEKALEIIQFLLYPDVDKPLSIEAQDSTIQDIKSILNPKSTRKSKAKKYDKETKDKVLQKMHDLVTPRKQRPSKTSETRDSVLQDIRYMLQAGKENLDIDADATRMEQDKEQERKSSFNATRQSLLANLKTLLETKHQSQLNDTGTLEDNIATTNQIVHSTPKSTPTRTSSGARSPTNPPNAPSPRAKTSDVIVRSLSTSQAPLDEPPN